MPGWRTENRTRRASISARSLADLLADARLGPELLAEQLLRAAHDEPVAGREAVAHAPAAVHGQVGRDAHARVVAGDALHEGPREALPLHDGAGRHEHGLLGRSRRDARDERRAHARP